MSMQDNRPRRVHAKKSSDNHSVVQHNMQLWTDTTGFPLLPDEQPVTTVRDSLYDLIPLGPREEKLIGTAPFLRLQKIKQLGFVYRVWPGATHTRYEHSLGSYYLAVRALRSLLQRGNDGGLYGISISSVQTLIVATLLPVHKTGHAFTKPVDALVGEAILAWEKVRPEQPLMIDAKTGEAAHFLFCYRAHRLHRQYLNRCLIPILCQKAGVPRTDARGPISSHRARSTIASQLFNAREPMTLFELQAWLGHHSPTTTQHYVSTSPTKLAQAYKDAGYFSRNVRAIEVLIDP